MSVRVQMENFGFSQKNTETKVFHTALENHGKFFSRKLNHCNTFILLVYLPITSLPMIVMLLEKWTSWKNDMHLLYVIRLSLPCSWQAKALMLQLLLFFLVSSTHGDSQAGQTLLVQGAAGGEGEPQDYVLPPTLGCLGLLLGRFCILGCSHIGGSSFSLAKAKGSQGIQLSLKTLQF